jgi:hypothetical protein
LEEVDDCHAVIGRDEDFFGHRVYLPVLLLFHGGCTDTS